MAGPLPTPQPRGDAPPQPRRRRWGLSDCLLALLWVCGSGGLLFLLFRLIAADIRPPG